MDIFNLSVRQIVEKIKNAEITSVELCKLYIERIKKGNTIIPETFSYINEMKITSSK